MNLEIISLAISIINLILIFYLFFKVKKKNSTNACQKKDCLAIIEIIEIISREMQNIGNKIEEKIKELR
jgi:hypothetical protein